MSPDNPYALFKRGSRHWPSDPRREADKAAASTIVDCAGCGRLMRHRGLFCGDCRRSNR